MADFGFLVAAFSVATSVWLYTGLSRRARAADAFWWSEYPAVARGVADAEGKGFPLRSAARALFVCDSCDGTLKLHNPRCPYLTGREMSPLVDAREVTS